jgi:hypothetical protein
LKDIEDTIGEVIDELEGPNASTNEGQD